MCRPPCETVDAVDTRNFRRVGNRARAGSTAPRRWHTNIAAQPPTAYWCSWAPGAAAAAGRFIICIFYAVSNRAFDEDGSTYVRLDLTLVRTVILGDRWEGDVKISGNSVRIVTDASRAERRVGSATIDARRP